MTKHAMFYSPSPNLCRLNGSTLMQGTWQWFKLFVFHLIAILLLATWLWQPTRVLWDQLDVKIFHALNAPLASHPLWACIWAFGSMRATDIAVGVVMLSFFLKGDWLFAKQDVRAALFAFLSALFLLLVLRAGPFSMLVDKLHWQHASPSLVLVGAVRIGALFPHWDHVVQIKDSSGNSFPGDHATVLLLWAFFITPFASFRQRVLVWLLLALFLMPRLVAGAHWGTDIFIGGLFLGLVTFAWSFYTPFVVVGVRLLEHLFAPVIGLLRAVPLINRLSIIAGG
ncbi:MAG: Kdo2-lipid A phosphotransferase [Rugosibacter sp.]|jgi:membrane-associated phospholipid phosphatase|nr:Kdo2-lipid A phosphotransferase [Rugosibacter sp.]